MTNKLYERLKFIHQIVIPLSAFAYLIIGSLFDWEHVKDVLTVYVIGSSLLGVWLAISTRKYHLNGNQYDGVMVVEENAEGGFVYSLVLDTDVDELRDKHSITFQVRK